MKADVWLEKTKSIENLLNSCLPFPPDFLSWFSGCQVDRAGPSQLSADWRLFSLELQSPPENAKIKTVIVDYSYTCVAC